MTPWRAITGIRLVEKGTLEELMRERIRATIEAIVDEELSGALARRHRSVWAWCDLATATASICAR
jgi:hypothetical protein